MRAPEFEALVGPARLYPALWRLGLGVLLIAFVYLGAALILAVVLFFGMGNPLAFVGYVQRLATPDTPDTVIVLLLTFLGLFLGPILAAAALHFRGPDSLIGPAGEALRGFGRAILAGLPLYAVVLGLAVAYDPPVANLAPGEWLRWLPLAVPLLMVQVSSEELVFRGYLQSQMAARFRGRFWWMVLPSALFAALHWSPEAGPAVGLVLANTFAFGLIAADLTERTGSLGAAIGLHFLNNFAALLIVAQKDTITGLALFVTPTGFEATGFVAAALALNIVFLIVVWRALVWALDA